MVTLGWPFFCFMAERSKPPARLAAGIRRPRAYSRVPLRIAHLPPRERRRANRRSAQRHENFPLASSAQKILHHDGRAALSDPCRRWTAATDDCNGATAHNRPDADGCRQVNQSEIAHSVAGKLAHQRRLLSYTKF
jgi:hypothetical protein